MALFSFFLSFFFVHIPLNCNKLEECTFKFSFVNQQDNFFFTKTWIGITSVTPELFFAFGRTDSKVSLRDSNSLLQAPYS